MKTKIFMSSYMFLIAAALISAPAEAKIKVIDKGDKIMVYSDNPEVKPAPLDEYFAADPFKDYRRAYEDNSYGEAAEPPKRNIYYEDASGQVRLITEQELRELQLKKQ